MRESVPTQSTRRICNRPPSFSLLPQTAISYRSVGRLRKFRPGLSLRHLFESFSFATSFKSSQLNSTQPTPNPRTYEVEFVTRPCLQIVQEKQSLANKDASHSAPALIAHRRNDWERTLLFPVRDNRSHGKGMIRSTLEVTTNDDIADRFYCYGLWIFNNATISTIVSLKFA